jgi:2-polyprenyl-6-methoxyphenol hydroxylase-like FAD-dependent oxidoreductase
MYRTGYPLAFLDRQQLVQTLYDHLENKSNVLINKNVIATEHSSDAVRIICDDGTSYDGHIVVGADGVSSKIREEMWRVASQTDAALISTEMKGMKAPYETTTIKETIIIQTPSKSAMLILTALTTSYRALFGISTAVINQEPGDFDWGYHRSQSSLVYAGPHGKTYYFMFEKLDQVLPWGKVPHYTKQEATDYAKKWTNWQIRPDITFHDVFQQSTSYGLAALEEGKFKTWSWGRIACLGDSIHKMTINIGTGGNTAIESVAAFTNELRIALDNCNGDLPTEDQIRKCFEAYQKRREDRAGFITDIAGEVMRLQAMEGPHHRFVAGYCLPYLGDFAANSMCDGLVNAEILVRILLGAF